MTANGLVDAGVLEDDSDRYVAGFDMQCGTRHPKGRIVLRIAEDSIRTEDGAA